MFKIILSAVIMTVLALADGPVLQTGQVKSYNANGDVVTDGSVKDDGYYQAGVTRSYGRNGDIVIDNTTGLQWEDNETIAKPWDAAGTYCSEFSLGDNNDWRLPNIEELITLVYEGERNPALMKGVFHKYISSYYWSSTTDSENTSNALLVGFTRGLLSNHGKTNPHYVRCVRGRALAPSNLSRDAVTEIVTDSTTTLQWQDDETVRITEIPWTNAIDHCENTLQLGGYNDWRLPTRKELLSIDQSTHFLFQQFTVLSSSTYLESPGLVWSVDLNRKSSSHKDKAGTFQFRCVRGGQFGHLTCPEGQQLKQGERICILGTPAPDPGEYPLIADRNYVQGDINTDGNRTEDLGWTDPYPPLCPPGQIQIRQGAGCVVDPATKILKDPCELKEGMAALPIDCWEPQHEHEIKGS